MKFKIRLLIELAHLFRFAVAQHPGIDKHAHQLFADGSGHQAGGYGGIHAARQGAQHPILADVSANLRNGVFHKSAGVPVAATAAGFENEIGQDVGAAGCVHHFGMELNAKNFPVAMANRGNGCIVGMGDDIESLRQRREMIAVAHPHCQRRRQTGKQLCGHVDAQLGAAIFTARCFFNLAAQHKGQSLQTVADAENGNIQIEELGPGQGRINGIYRRGAAG